MEKYTLKKAQEDYPGYIVYEKADGSFSGVPKGLIEKQKVSKPNVKKIIKLHLKRDALYALMEKTDDAEALKILAKRVTENELDLQDLWKFERNVDFHKFWEMPKCKCPRLDNIDAYPTGYYVKSGDCPIHGSEV